jgi:hypothetical protein
MTPDISTIRAAREEEQRWLDALEGKALKHAQTVTFALSFYEKCLQELSEEAIECGYSAGDGEIRANSIFKAVITQIQKEVAGEQKM